MVLEDEHGSQLHSIYAQFASRDDFVCIVIDNEEIRAGYEYPTNEYFIFPAATPEEATELFEQRIAVIWQKEEDS